MSGTAKWYWFLSFDSLWLSKQNGGIGKEVGEHSADSQYCNISPFGMWKVFFFFLKKAEKRSRKNDRLQSQNAVWVSWLLITFCFQITGDGGFFVCVCTNFSHKKAKVECPVFKDICVQYSSHTKQALCFHMYLKALLLPKL